MEIALYSFSFEHFVNVCCKIGAGPSRRINQADAPDANIPRRAQIARNQRRNAPQQSEAAAAQQESEDSDDGDTSRPNPFAEAKIGTKKRAKMEAKAEKQRLREAELLLREVPLNSKPNK